MSGFDVVARADKQRYALRDDALQESDLRLVIPGFRMIRSVVDVGFSERVTDIGHVASAELILARAAAPPFMHRFPVNSGSVAGDDLVAHRVQHEHVVRAVDPARIPLQLVLGEIALRLHHHRCAAHELPQGLVARIGIQCRSAHFVRVASAGPVARIQPGADHGGIAVPVDLDHVRRLRHLSAGRRIGKRVVDPAGIDNRHHSVDLVEQVRPEVVDRLSPELALPGRIRRVDESLRFRPGLRDSVDEDVSGTMLPALVFVEGSASFLRAVLRKVLCCALDERLDIAQRLDGARGNAAISTATRHRRAASGFRLRDKEQEANQPRKKP